MKVTVQTPDGPRLVPHWAKCHCVTRHSPNYIHPYPFALPNGIELWLCPNTFHQANTLLKLYSSLDGPPEGRVAVKFNYFVRSLITYYWQLVLEARASDEEYEAWKASQVQEEDDEFLNINIQEIIKKTVAHGS